MNGNGQHLRFETSAFARVTFTFAHKPLNITAHKIAVSFFMPTLQVRNNAFICCIKISAHAESDIIFLIAGTIQNFLYCIIGDVFHLVVDAESVFFTNSREFLHVPCIRVYAVKWTKRALSYRKIRVKYQLRINLESAA